MSSNKTLCSILNFFIGLIFGFFLINFISLAINPPLDIPFENRPKTDELFILIGGCLFILFVIFKEGIFCTIDYKEELCGRGINAFSKSRPSSTKKEIRRPHIHDKNFKRYRRY